MCSSDLGEIELAELAECCRRWRKLRRDEERIVERKAARQKRREAKWARALKKQANDVPQAASMLQAIKNLKQMPAASKRAIDSFLSLGFAIGSMLSVVPAESAQSCDLPYQSL